MSYESDKPQRTLTRAQQDALLDVSPEDLRKLSASERINLAYLHAEHRVRKQEAFWTAVQGFALGALPVLTFFGILDRRGSRG